MAMTAHGLNPLCRLFSPLRSYSIGSLKTATTVLTAGATTVPSTPNPFNVHQLQQQQLPRRKMTTSMPSVQQRKARFSQGSDEAALSPALETLLGQGRWALVNDGEALERSFKFKNFAKTWDFMTAVSLQCKVYNHHPEWSNVYNTTFIRWTTHNPKGLSSKDLKLALICDALAKDFGEVEVLPTVEGEAEAATCGIRSLADKAAGTAGDCCTPKPKK